MKGRERERGGGVEWVKEEASLQQQNCRERSSAVRVSLALGFFSISLFSPLRALIIIPDLSQQLEEQYLARTDVHFIICLLSPLHAASAFLSLGKLSSTLFSPFLEYWIRAQSGHTYTTSFSLRLSHLSSSLRILLVHSCTARSMRSGLFSSRKSSGERVISRVTSTTLVILKVGVAANSLTPHSPYKPIPRDRVRGATDHEGGSRKTFPVGRFTLRSTLAPLLQLSTLIHISIYTRACYPQHESSFDPIHVTRSRSVVVSNKCLCIDLVHTSKYSRIILYTCKNMYRLYGAYVFYLCTRSRVNSDKGETVREKVVELPP